MTRSGNQVIIEVLRRVVPEPEPSPGRAESVRRQAARIRTRRRASLSCVAVVVVLTIAVPAFLTSAGDARDGSDIAVQALREPLDLPTTGDGAACPVSPTRRFPGGAGFSGPFSAQGAGPVYLALAGEEGVVLPSREGDDAAEGWRSQKVIWVVDPDYAGPLLLRGARIDRPGGLRFSHYLGALGYSGTGAGDGKAYRELVYLRRAAAESQTSVLASYPSAVFVRGPGCYAVQVNGVGVSETLVFRVLPPGS